MRTRIIQTKFWIDSYIQSLKVSEKLLFLFFISNDRIEKTGAYEMTISDICHMTGIPNSEVIKIIEKFHNDNKISYIDGYVVCKNAKRYQDFSKGSAKQLEGYEKEVRSLPESVKDYLFNEIKLVPNQLPTSSQLVIKNKEENIKNKEENIKHKTEEEEIAEYTAKLFNRTVKVTNAWSKNFREWRKTYAMEDIKKALDSWKSKGWIWQMDKQGGDLILLFRTSNKAGDCDYMDQLINRSQSNSSRKPTENEYVDSNGNIRVKKQNV